MAMRVRWVLAVDNVRRSLLRIDLCALVLSLPKKPRVGRLVGKIIGVWGVGRFGHRRGRPIPYSGAMVCAVHEAGCGVRS